MAEPRSRRIRVAAEVSLDVVERGAGPAILLLHGLGDSWRSFRPILPLLPGSVRALVPTQRGHGDSDHPARDYSIERFAADAVAVLDAAGVASAVVVGHSMGSAVAQELALSWPERVSRLVLVGSATTFDTPVLRELAEALLTLEDPVPEAFAREFQSSVVHQPLPSARFDEIVAESRKVPAHVWRGALAGCIDYRACDRLATIGVPTLILGGVHDGICTEQEQRRLQAAIPGSALVLYDDAAHCPNWEHPQRFTDDLMTFAAGKPVASVRPALARSA